MAQVFSRMLFVVSVLCSSVGVAAGGGPGSTAAVSKERGAGAIAPADVPGDWWSAAQRDIAAREYQATWQDRTTLADVGAAWQAPNRAQNFRTYFTAEGIRVIPRTAHKDVAPAWEWGLQLCAWGRSGAMEAARPATIRTNGNRVEYVREGIVEWYVNDARGLEQGFTIESRLNEESCGAFLRLEMSVVGNVTAGLMADGAVEFLAPGGARAIQFVELHVEDARGERLAAWFEVAGGCMAILVADEGAVYPITIDPLATSPAWSVEGNQDGAEFGFAVGTAGDVNGDGYSDVIVGAPYFDNGQTDEGRAFVYHGSAAGLSASPNWMAEGNQGTASFGMSVGTAGDVNADGYSDVIVGAPLSNNGQPNEGRAFVYHGSAGGLSASPNWTAEANQGESHFGSSVGTAGDVNGDGYSDVIVGAPDYDNGLTDQGMAYVYYGSASGLSPVLNWSVSGSIADLHLGAAVATAGDVNGDGYSDVMVGQPFENLVGFTDVARVSVYHGSVSGLSATENWGVTMTEGHHVGLGKSLGTAGDVNGDGYSDVIYGKYEGLSSATGDSAHVHLGSPTGLSGIADWNVYPASFDIHGDSGLFVGTAGDVNGDGYSDVIVQAYTYPGGSGNEYTSVYHGSAAGPSATPTWSTTSVLYLSSGATAGDVNGDGYSDVVFGCRSYDNGQISEGIAFVYHGSAAGLSVAAGWSAESNQANAYYGHCVASAGDVNGDGFGDIVVGAYNYDNGESNEGRAFVYHGSSSGPTTTANWTAESNQVDAYFGVSAGNAGDVNGDGYSDLIVGAHFYNNGQTDEGRAYVYHGSSGGLSATANWTAESNQSTAYFGVSVGTAGDVNGDGYGDVIVGANGYSNGQTDEGRAYVYHGSSTGLSATANWTDESNQANAYYGNSVGTAGDVNGDGFSDVIVGAYNHFSGQTAEGRAFVYHGSASGLLPTESWSKESNATNAYFGRSVGTAGDVNGDGFSDVIVGADGYTNGQTGEGAAYVFHGSPTGLSTLSNWQTEGNAASNAFGYSVATAGDVNGDGYSDVIVGAPYADGDSIEGGKAHVYHGSAMGLSGTADWSGQGGMGGAHYGVCVSSAGDVNGDGYGDVIVGELDYGVGEAGEGRARVYYGNGGGGRATLPRQQTTTSINIPPLGLSDSQTTFRIRYNFLSTYGRTRMRSEYEAKPFGVPFDGTGLVAGSLFDIGSNGAQAYTRLIGGLAPGALYHWRVRTRYDMTKTPFQRHGPWIHIPTNGWNEADLRTPIPITPPQITQNPQAATRCVGGGATFSVIATGSPTPMYQWRRNGGDLSNGGAFSGATSATLTISPVGLASAGSYDCVVTNVAGSDTSATAGLTVHATATGDANANGIANGADVQAFVAIILAGGSPGPGYCGCDFTGNGVVTLADRPGFLAKLLAP